MSPVTRTVTTVSKTWVDRLLRLGNMLLMAKEKARDDFSEPIKQLLARRAGYRCSICEQPTVGPHSDDKRAVYLGEASHICSAAAGGPRADASLTQEQRSSATNGIHLCKVHAKFVDTDVDTFSADKLRDIKAAHEAKIRSVFLGQAIDYDPDFLDSHETQVIHSRGAPSLADLWVPRHVGQIRHGQAPLKREAVSLLEDESRVIIVSGDQWSGRTSLLKRLAAEVLNRRNSVWLSGRAISERVFKDPVAALAEGCRKLYGDPECWVKFLDADPSQNIVFVDDLHLSPLNLATKRKFLAVLEQLARRVIVTANEPFLVEMMAVTTGGVVGITEWRLLEFDRGDCIEMVERWCRFGAVSVPDDELDRVVAQAQDQLEIAFGRNLIPRTAPYVLTALQTMDAGSPLETSVGSFGGVYETMIHLALARNARTQATISSEKAYLEELAYWCEFSTESADRAPFNKWFADRKAVHLGKSEEIERSLLAKGFLSRVHPGFRFNYQKYYFLASFIRSNPERKGVRPYVSRLVAECWNEDFANTALFLAYLQPSSFLVEALMTEARGLFREYQPFEIGDWEMETDFPKGFFKGLTFSSDVEQNRKLLAGRLDHVEPVESAECVKAGNGMTADEDQVFLSYLKGFHLIKMMGQLIRNSPVAFDGDQKRGLVAEGFSLARRMVSFVNDVCGPANLKAQALAQLRSKVLKKGNRAELEAKLSGLMYAISQLMVFVTLRHACFFLGHPDLALVYKDLLRPDEDEPGLLTERVLACGLNFELRCPSSDELYDVCRDLSSTGQDLLRTWAWFFLWYNRVPVAKRQAILESLDMSPAAQLLLPKGA
jgi:hypothetical protein